MTRSRPLKAYSNNMFRLVLRISNNIKSSWNICMRVIKTLWCGFESSLDLFTTVYDKQNIVIPYDFVLVVPNKGVLSAQTLCVCASFSEDFSVRLVLVSDLANLKKTQNVWQSAHEIVSCSTSVDHSNSIIFCSVKCSWVSDGCGKATKTLRWQVASCFLLEKWPETFLSLLIRLQCSQGIMHTA